MYVFYFCLLSLINKLIKLKRGFSCFNIKGMYFIDNEQVIN